jgi:transcriptional regulator with XRE-family HTH domain
MVSEASVRRAVARAIRKRRLAVGLTQQELASRLRSSVAYVGRVERGKTNIAAAEFVRIALALGADPVELLREVVSKRKRRD